MIVQTITKADNRGLHGKAVGTYMLSRQYNARDKAGAVSLEDFPRSKKYKYEKHGLAAELAVCRNYNVFYDQAIREPNDAPSYDCVIHGLTVDVKCGTYEKSKLYVNHYDKRKPEDYPDIFILVLSHLFPEMHIMGFADNALMIAQDNRARTSKGNEVYQLEGAKVIPIEQLYNYYAL